MVIPESGVFNIFLFYLCHTVSCAEQYTILMISTVHGMYML